MNENEGATTGEVTESKGYKLIAREVTEWLSLHKGETFDLDLVCKQLNIVHSQSRKYASVKLSDEVKSGRLEKNNKTYLFVDKEVTLMNDWVDVTLTHGVPLEWPQGCDGTQFGFDGCVDIPEKGLVIIAGVTNTGKSTFMRNMLWMNMRGDRHCTYFTSETSKEDFKDYASRMTWGKPLDETGKPVFDLIDRHNDFHHVIRPNDINFIDWLNLGDKFYSLGEVLAAIKRPLDKGIAVIAIQKDAKKELGMGGQWGEHLASLYLAMDWKRITVKKAKKWCHSNPNGQTWGFEIEDRGCHFADIHPLKKCGSCFEGKSKGQDCMKCGGTGWISVRE